MQAVNEWATRLAAPSVPNQADPRHKDTHVATLCHVAEAGYHLCRLSLGLDPADARVAAVWVLATASKHKAVLTSPGSLGHLRWQPWTPPLAVEARRQCWGKPTPRHGHLEPHAAFCWCSRLFASCARIPDLMLQALQEPKEHEASPSTTPDYTRAKRSPRWALAGCCVELLRRAPAQLSRSVSVPPPGGWESLWLESEAIFHLLRALLRALLVRVKVNARVVADASSAAAMDKQLHDLAQHVVQLQQKPIQMGATPAASCIQLANGLYSQGTRTFVDSIVDENGRNLVGQEIEWWQELFTSQLAAGEQRANSI